MNKNNNLTPRKIKALETKKLLFDAAIDLFAEKGYDKVSVDDITSKAGTSKGTFYIYFKNKEHIILEQFELIDTFYLKTFKSIPKNQTAKEKLLTFVKEQQLYVTDKFGLELLTVVYYSQLTQDKEKFYLVNEKRILYKIVQKVITEGQQAREFRADISDKELTKLVTFWMRSMLYDWCIQDGNFNLVEQGQKLFSMFIDGMLKAR